VPTPVVLSQQEIGDGSPLKAMTEDVHDLHFVQHKGSWRSLMASGLRAHLQDTSERVEAGQDGAREKKERKEGDQWTWSSTELAQYLPKTGFLDRNWRSCAVVGSAYHMDGSRFGSEIDSHQVIACVNGFLCTCVFWFVC
jgi:hypothetical protein